MSMDYRLQGHIFIKKRCVLRCTLQTMIKDISYLNTADGLSAFARFKESWQHFETAVSLELYEYGQLIKGWSKEEGDYLMGKLSQSNKETFKSIYVTKSMKAFLKETPVFFHIQTIEEKTSLQGKRAYELGLKFENSFEYEEVTDEGERSLVTVNKSDIKKITLEDDDTRYSVFNKRGASYLGNDLPYGPCKLAWKGKYQLIEDAEEEEGSDGDFLPGVVEDDAVEQAVHSNKKARK